MAGDEPTLDAGLAKVKAKLLVMPSQSDLLVYPKYSQEAAEHLKKLEKTVQYSEILVMAVTTSIEDIDTVGDQIKRDRAACRRRLPGAWSGLLDRPHHPCRPWERRRCRVYCPPLTFRKLALCSTRGLAAGAYRDIEDGVVRSLSKRIGSGLPVT